MKKMNLCATLSILAALLLVTCNSDVDTSKASTSTTSTTVNEQKTTLAKYEFNDQKELLILDSDNYRRWVYVGTPLTPNDLNPPEAAFPEFHNVYIHPDDYNYWQTNGKWQDGTILVKELVLVGKKQEVSGNGYFMGDFTGLEVTIKDKKLYPDEPGNWAYFSFGHSYPLAKTAKAFPTAACNACHAASAADDFVFTQDYPILRAAKNAKNKSTGYLENKVQQKENELKKDIKELEREKLISFLIEVKNNN